MILTTVLIIMSLVVLMYLVMVITIMMLVSLVVEAEIIVVYLDRIGLTLVLKKVVWAWVIRLQDTEIRIQARITESITVG